jgi:hypothetical protein
MPQDPTRPLNSTDRQLHGWKDISTYFGRSVRTVQRWERDFGLPIRRYGLGRSEVVHVYVDDIERWKETLEAEAASRGANGEPDEPLGLDGSLGGTADGTLNEAEPGQARTGTVDLPSAIQGDAPVAPRRAGRLRRSLFAAAVLSGLAAVGLGVLGWGWEAPRSAAKRPAAAPGASPDSTSEPARWTTVGDTLLVSNSDGKDLWRHVFPEPLENKALVTDRNGPGLSEIVADVDGDGHKELIYRVVPADMHKLGFGFVCFSHTGSVLWSFMQVKTQVFGDMSYSRPFPADRVFLTPRDRPGFDVWLVSVHSPWFPSSMTRIEPDGSISAEYWSNGYISLVRGATIAGRRVLVVAARNNESEGASVALLDASAPSGSAPAEQRRYRCRTCPPGRPLRFVQIPRPSRLRTLHGTSMVGSLDVDPSSRITVRLDHTFDVDQVGGVVVYTFDAELRPLSVGLGASYEFACQALEGRKAIPPLPNTPAIDEVRAVRWWDGTRFIELNAPVFPPAARSMR